MRVSTRMTLALSAACLVIMGLHGYDQLRNEDRDLHAEVDREMRLLGDAVRVGVEASLREVNAELTRVARVSALGAFATSIAHEINQPLAAVVTNSEASIRWLANQPSNVEMAVKAVERAARDARRASEVVARMRAMVTKQTPHQAEFDANDAIAEVLSLTQSERQKLDVKLSLAMPQEAVMAFGDRIQIQQVLLNLIVNAIEAMREVADDQRSLTIRGGRDDDGNLMIEIEDRGAGIDPGVAERIFDHLFTTKVGGTGLGLAISHSIIEAHGGRIWAEPATPRGTVFKFSLPAAGRGEA